MELFCKGLDRVEELGNVHIKCNDSATGDGLSQELTAVNIALATEIEQAEDRCDIEQVDDRAEDAKDEDLLVLRPVEFVVFLVELIHLLLFL